MAGFQTLGDFADALAEETKIIYDESLFSHWQNGRKILHDRNLLI